MNYIFFILLIWRLPTINPSQYPDVKILPVIIYGDGNYSSADMYLNGINYAILIPELKPLEIKQILLKSIRPDNGGIQIMDAEKAVVNII